MISYRRKPRIRVHRFAVPELPFRCAALVSPYGGAPAAGLVFDWAELTVSARAQGEASVADAAIRHLPDPMPSPAAIDGTPFAETVFACAGAISTELGAAGIEVVHVRSLEGHLPAPSSALEVVVFWPPRIDLLRALPPHPRRGVLVPVIYPATTDLELLAEMADSPGISFLAAAAIEPDATAKRTLASDDESYEALFHSDLHSVVVATERHIAALARERGLADAVPVSGTSNWAAAAALALAGERLVRMDDDVELGWTVIRSARAVADTDKPLDLISRAASVSIIGDLDEVSAEALTEWLETGDAEFLRDVNQRWRLRRDYMPASHPPGL
jgi:hypothetical protein